jgi:hypothetical protein
MSLPSLAAVMLLLTAVAVSAQTSTQGAIEGQVVMASKDSTASLGGLPVSLFTFINGARQIPPIASQTDAQGHVRFGGITNTANITFQMIVKFQDAFYYSGPISFTTGSNVANTSVNVYDSTTDSRAVRIDQHHLIIDVDSDARMLSFVELYVIANSGDRAVTGSPDVAAGGKRVSFRAPIPPGAQVDTIEDRAPNQDVFLTVNQLLDTQPLLPGQSTLVFTYRLPVDRSTMAVSVGSPYTTTQLNVLASPRITVRAPRLSAQGSVNAGGQPFQLLNAKELPPGTTIAVELNGLPASVIPLDVLQWLPLAIATLALGALIVVAARARNDDGPTRRKTSA